MGPRAPRKRTIEDVNSDSHKFLQSYYNKRGIPQSPTDDANLLSECVTRAEDAREDFKRWRASVGDSSYTGHAGTSQNAPGPDGNDDDGDSNPSPDGDASNSGPQANAPKLSAKEKYLKRLANNRKSADAARVYQEVLRREHSHALREVTHQRDALSSDVARLTDTLHKLREENARLARVAGMVPTADAVERDNVDSVVADSDDDDARSAAAKLCMLGSQPLESEVERILLRSSREEPDVMIERKPEPFLPPSQDLHMPGSQGSEAVSVGSDAVRKAREYAEVASSAHELAAMAAGSVPAVSAAYSTVGLPSSQGDTGYRLPPSQSTILDQFADPGNVFNGSQSIAPSQGFGGSPREASQQTAT